MSKVHTVLQGEHVTRIAQQYGFTDYRIIWDHASNADLKKTRKNPDVLLPGDRISIPELQRKEESCSTGGRHKFEAPKKRLSLYIVLQNAARKAMADIACEIRVEGERHALVTDDRGMISCALQPTAERAVLTIGETSGDAPIQIRIGHLDPVEEPSGQAARLNNLGYFAGPIAGFSEADNKLLFLSAIEEFQCEQKLTVDGKCGPKTQAELKRVHGS